MLIKCPECGREISDKAPTCPHCGVPIAGHVQSTTSNYAQNQGQPVRPSAPVDQKSMESTQSYQPANNPQTPKKKSNTGIYIFSFILALIICGVGYYFYNEGKSSDEQAQYELAMQSSDPAVLQAFLANFPEASREHRDSIQAHLTSLSQLDREWNDAIISNSRASLQAYIDQHPDSPHKQEALNKIDSIDWVSAKGANTPEALKSYVDGHPNGKYIDEANDLIRNINSSTVQPEEKAMITSLFRTFFQGVNSKDETRLTSTVNSLLTTFLGKSDATKSDVVYFMNKLWKDDVSNLNWRILDDYSIDKKEVGNNEYEFSVTFSADQAVTKVDGENVENKYRIKAKVNPDGKISEFTMSKVLQ